MYSLNPNCTTRPSEVLVHSALNLPKLEGQLVVACGMPRDPGGPGGPGLKSSRCCCLVVGYRLFSLVIVSIAPWDHLGPFEVPSWTPGTEHTAVKRLPRARRAAGHPGPAHVANPKKSLSTLPTA